MVRCTVPSVISGRTIPPGTIYKIRRLERETSRCAFLLRVARPPVGDQRCLDRRWWPKRVVFDMVPVRQRLWWSLSHMLHGVLVCYSQQPRWSLEGAQMAPATADVR